jgi:hypothetical protein
MISYPAVKVLQFNTKAPAHVPELLYLPNDSYWC